MCMTDVKHLVMSPGFNGGARPGIGPTGGTNGSCACPGWTWNTMVTHTAIATTSLAFIDMVSGLTSIYR